MKKELTSKTPKTRLHNIPVPIIGLTGGIATGKSTVSDKLKALGHPVICADTLVKEIYKTSKTTDHLKKYYPQVLSGEKVDFKKLREKFFLDKTIQEDIERLIYSQMSDTFWKFYNNLGNVNYLFYDVPLLFEKELDKLVDYKVTVYAPREVQQERLLKRDKIDISLVNEILDKQIDIEKKKGLSDSVIDNSRDLSFLSTSISDFLKTLES